jgi:hypothetical protein
MVADALAGNILAEATNPLGNIFADAMRGADWFGALRLLRDGGGGAGISFRRLADAAASDFPNNSNLRKLIG